MSMDPGIRLLNTIHRAPTPSLAHRPAIAATAFVIPTSHIYVWRLPAKLSAEIRNQLLFIGHPLHLGISNPIESSDEVAAIHFSSGTTGNPKGVVLSHRALILLMNQAGALGMTNKVCFGYAATHWINNTETILTTLWLKIPRIILPPFEAYAACAMMQKYRANWISVTPYMIDKLVKCDAAIRCDLSSLSDVLYTGNLLSIASYRALKRLVPSAQIISLYGVTETASNISMQSSKSQPGSCGEIMENARVKIIDRDTGRILAANQEGELLLNSACGMTCYYNNPVATAQFMDEDGWLYSGDIGYYDESGEIFVTGRIKDMAQNHQEIPNLEFTTLVILSHILKYADIDVSPSQFEDVILSHPGVKEVAVVGQLQPNDDELPIAFVVRTENPSYTGDQVTEADIINLVAAPLSSMTAENSFTLALSSLISYQEHLPTRLNARYYVKSQS